MADKSDNSGVNLPVVALVALVAIVGLVALIMNAALVKQIAFGSQIAQAQPTTAKNTAGQASRLACIANGGTDCDNGFYSYTYDGSAVVCKCVGQDTNGNGVRCTMSDGCAGNSAGSCASCLLKDITK